MSICKYDSDFIIIHSEYCDIVKASTNTRKKKHICKKLQINYRFLFKYSTKCFDVIEMQRDTFHWRLASN